MNGFRVPRPLVCNTLGEMNGLGLHVTSVGRIHLSARGPRHMVWKGVCRRLRLVSCRGGHWEAKAPKRQMPAVPSCTESTAAWALVCIFQILAADSRSGADDWAGFRSVAPPPGLEQQSDLPDYAVVRCDSQLQRCKCRFCSFRCCRIGQPHSVHRCKRHRNW